MKRSTLRESILAICMAMISSLAFSQAVNTPIDAQTDIFTVTLDITPSHDSMNAAVGFSKGEIGSWGDMSTIIIVTNDGTFGARNGGGYEYMSLFPPYEAGETYGVVITVDVPNSTYSATVKAEGGFETTVAYNFAFRAAADTINNLFSYNNDAVAWGGIVGASLPISNYEVAAEVSSDDYFAIEPSIHKNFAIPTLSGNVICEFDVTPTVDSINAAVSLNNAPSMANPGWSAMSTIVSFNDQGNINCRNGGAYEDPATPYPYNKDQQYHVKMELNIDANTYDVYITDDTATVLLADDFAFRNATQELKYRVITSVSGDQSELLVTKFDFSYPKVEQDMNTPIEAQTDVFTASFNIRPSHDNMNAAVGFSEGEVSAWGDMSTILIVTNDGTFGARNGGGYEYVSLFPEYEANKTYRVVITVDLPNSTYSATVQPEGGFETTVAYNFAFRAAADTINYLFSYNNELEAWGGIPGARLYISNFNLADTVASSSYFAIEPSVYQNFAIPAQTESMICEFEVTPSVDSINAAVSLNNAPSLEAPAGWSAMSTILSFNDQGTINCSNGDVYEDPATPYVYTKDQTYKVRMEVNITDNIYDVYITGEDMLTTLLADDFAFRNATQELNYRVITSVNGDQSELLVTKFAIYDGMLDYSELTSVIDSSKAVVDVEVVVGLAVGEYFQETIDAADAAISAAEAVNGMLLTQEEITAATAALRAAMSLYTPNLYDYVQLGAVIDSSRAVIDAGLIGNDEGEYSMAVMNAANMAVSSAKTVLAGADSQAEIDQAIADLRTAMTLFVPNEPSAVIDVPGAGFAMYPNPVKDVLHIKNISEVKSVSIYNSAGIEISVYSNSGESMNINLADVNAGLYIIKFTSDDIVKTKRFIKN